MCVLGLSFASYDLIVRLLGKATTLFNVRVNDGWRIDESYMYLAGTAKTVLFDPYLKEHAGSLTLRPTLPTAIFVSIYWLCGKSINVAIFVTHVVPPMVSCLLLYLIAIRLTGSRRYAVFATLLGVGHFVYTAVVIWNALTGSTFVGIAGPDLYLLQQLFGKSFGFDEITAPTQFTRLFSPALTLPFLLAPLYLILANRRPVIRGALIALNLFVYPHHVIILGILEATFWIKRRKFPAAGFFLAGLAFSSIYIAQNLIVFLSGSYADVYARVGVTHKLSTMWFFSTLFMICAATQCAIARKRTGIDDGCYFTIGCALSAALILAFDVFLTFPQVHLVGLRIYAFLAPISLVCLGRQIWPTIPALINPVVFLLVFASQAYAGWLHRYNYADFPRNGIAQEMEVFPAGSVVMTDVQYEIPYISAVTDKYSYIAYGIVSAAGNDELLRRFAVLATIYDWDGSRFQGGDWDGLLPVYHWVYHHGVTDAAVGAVGLAKAIDEIRAKSKCDLLTLYQVDFIRFRDAPPVGLDMCTKPVSQHFLQVMAKK